MQKDAISSIVEMLGRAQAMESPEEQIEIFESAVSDLQNVIRKIQRSNNIVHVRASGDDTHYEHHEHIGRS